MELFYCSQLLEQVDNAFSFEYFLYSIIIYFKLVGFTFNMIMWIEEIKINNSGIREKMSVNLLKNDNR